MKTLYALILSLAVLIAAPSLAQTPTQAPTGDGAPTTKVAPTPAIDAKHSNDLKNAAPRSSSPAIRQLQARQVVEPHLTRDQAQTVESAAEAVSQAMANFELVCRRIDGANDLGDSMMSLQDGKWYKSTHSGAAPAAVQPPAAK